MEKVLFVTNKIFVDKSKPEGGVSYCTNEYISLLQTKFEVLIFELQTSSALSFRLKSKIGIDVFDEFNADDYKHALKKQIIANNITKVFINLSTASAISETIKGEFNDKVKIILCSHGIEAGDFLHQSVSFKSELSWLQKLTSSYKLGRILQRELSFRLNCFDLVLTVSEIEVAIEKWMSAKKVFFVPRVLTANYIDWQPVTGRLGFVGDINHFPNYYGITMLCEAIVKNKMDKTLTIRVAGKPCENLQIITDKFSFVESIGYLDNDKLMEEAGTWMYYLNLVFFYSKGVSTKLGKGMNWGLPVISTEAGNRGYAIGKGEILTAVDADQIVSIIKSRIENRDLLLTDKKNTEVEVRLSATYNDLMSQLYPVLLSL